MKMGKMSRTRSMVAVIILSVIMFVVFYVICYYRWEHLWALDVSITNYEVMPQADDDTLRVVMIGDSWAGIHHENGLDTFLCLVLQEKVSCPVTVVSKGIGGEKCRGIYQLIFSNDSLGVKALFTIRPDYCIISAGINDAVANLGTLQYCHYYHQILDFLLANHIRPVVLEIPNVNIWHIYGGKPFKDIIVDFLKSTMTRCKMYQFREYREALYQMLVDEHLIENVIYVSMEKWNERSPDIDTHLFLADQIHLNYQGYEKLDRCIAIAIANDLEKSR